MKWKNSLTKSSRHTFNACSYLTLKRKKRPGAANNKRENKNRKTFSQLFFLLLPFFDKNKLSYIHDDNKKNNNGSICLFCFLCVHFHPTPFHHANVCVCAKMCAQTTLPECATLLVLLPLFFAHDSRRDTGNWSKKWKVIVSLLLPYTHTHFLSDTSQQIWELTRRRPCPRKRVRKRDALAIRVLIVASSSSSSCMWGGYFSFF